MRSVALPEVFVVEIVSTRHATRQASILAFSATIEIARGNPSDCTSDFYKSASQWVRDVLTDPEISQVTGFPLSLESADTTVDGWPAQPPRTFAGPIYGASYDEWHHNAGSEDRAIIVLRDPRDIVSLWCSRLDSVIFPPLLRGFFAAPSPPHPRAIACGSACTCSQTGRSACEVGERFPAVNANSRHVSRPDRRSKERIQLHLPLPELGRRTALLHRIIDRHSFERRTGRRPGDVNPYSHRRKGIAADWRNYFDRELGAEFEASFPGLLVDLRFEKTRCWYEMLPAHSNPHALQPHSPAPAGERWPDWRCLRSNR